MKKRDYKNRTVGDGCTKVPDFTFKKCCDEHDRCYSDGGSYLDKMNCDFKLLICISRSSLLYVWVALVYYVGVTVFGCSHFNFSRWFLCRKITKFTESSKSFRDDSEK